MTIEEAIKHGQEQLEVFGGEHKEFIKLAIKALEQELKTKGSYHPVISGNFQNPPKVKSAETED